MRLALANAFDFRRAQRTDFPAALVLALLAHPKGEREQLGEHASQRRVALDLAHDVARGSAEIGAQRPQRPVRPLELLGVGVALMGDQRVFADPFVGLAQDDAVLLGQPNQSFARAMHQLGVGGKRHRLGPHRGVDDDLGKVRRLGRAGSRGDIQALLNPRDELLLAHALAPACQRRAVENQNSSPQNS